MGSPRAHRQANSTMPASFLSALPVIEIAFRASSPSEGEQVKKKRLQLERVNM